MKIVVCIKQVPQTNQVEVDPQTGVLRRDSGASKMNPYDLYALEMALRLRQRHGGAVAALSMGPPQAESILREAFAMGADEGYLMTDRRFGGADVLATSYTLSQGIRALAPFDLILCGKQTTDGDTAQVGAEIGEMLGIPSFSMVTDIDAERGYLTCGMDLGSVIQTVRTPLPCLLMVEKSTCQPRLPSYLLKKATKERPVTTLTLDDLPDRNPDHYGISGSPTQVQRIYPPDNSVKQRLFTGDADALCEGLMQTLLDLRLLQRKEGSVCRS